MQREGLSNCEIADKIGIETKTVTALVAYRNRQPDLRRGPIGEPYTRDVAIPIDLMLRLRRSAAERDMTVENLIRALLTMIVDDQLISAVLDVEKCKT